VRYAGILRGLGLVLLGGTLLVLVEVVAVSADTTRVVPGVRAAGSDVGWLDAAALHARLETSAAAASSDAVVVTLPERTRTATHGEIGVALNVDRTTAEALAIGHTGSLLDRVRDLAQAASGAIDIGWPRQVADPSRLGAFLADIASGIDRPAVDGAVAISADGVTVTRPRSGALADRAGLEAALLAARSEDSAARLVVNPVPPEIDEAGMREAEQRAVAAFAPMTFSAGSESVTVSAWRIAQTVRIDRVDVDGSDRLVATLDVTAVAVLVDDVAAELDGDPRAAVLIPGEDRLTVAAGRDGVRIDRSRSLPVLAAAIFEQGEPERGVVLPATVEAPTLTTADAQRFAESVHLVGGFTTYFPVNQARATNIGLAAERFDGMVVGPGESFSFWGRIGEVSPRTGYVSAGAIVGGVSSTAIGGGLCQVSTTFFNAVARAGMRIDARQPHSYYIERYPVGMDAAVFAPSVDFRWTNDSAETVYLRAAADATSVSFWLYSADAHRSTVFPPPVEANFRYPYAGQPADPAHAPGYVVLGRDVWATRIVLMDGVEVSRDVWYSHYAPVWGGPAR
jgi:vancomycin resistance protein YoaR